MGQARLTRIDAVREMAAALDAFRSEAMAAIEGLDMEVRRALEWIQHDRHDHWNHEVRRGWDRITETRIQLQQAKTARRVGEHEPACADEKKALARAKQRLEVAQERVEAVRHCAREIERAVDDYRGARTPLSAWLDSEASKALAALRRMAENLEDYLAVHATGGGPVDTSPPVHTGTLSDKKPALLHHSEGSQVLQGKMDSTQPSGNEPSGSATVDENPTETPAPGQSAGIADNLGATNPANQPGGPT
jgi:hypothetical protein